MAKKGLVFITINYRLGVFGFLAHPELSAESPAKVSGNYGFLDQVAALQWIQNNIAAFGGDPGNVTIAGQSAGSMSVNVLIASPTAKGLFHKAIAESGGIFSNRIMKNLADGEKSGSDFMQKTKVASLAELRKMTAAELQKASEGMGFGSFGPIQDGMVIPTDLFTYFKNGKQNDVPVLSGWVTGDASLFDNQSGNAEAFIKQAKGKSGTKADEFLKLFPASTNEECKASQSKLALISFAVISSHYLAICSRYKAYLYQFSHVPASKPGFPNYGAFHTSEVPYALHTLNKWTRAWTSTDMEVEKVMSAYWFNFAKTGNPNGEGLPEWKNYDRQLGYIIELGDKPELQEGIFKQALEFLEDQANSK